MPESQTRCIVCGGTEVEEFLDLGETALANRFITTAELGEKQPRFPLKVGFCPGCCHVQLTSKVPPAQMFEDYLYVSSASDTLKRHLYELSDLLVERHSPGPSGLVIDIGCNDGTLLAGFGRHNLRRLGVDPARNLAAFAEANGNGVERHVGFFNSRSAAEIVERHGKAAIVTATNTFPHIPELHDFVEGIDTVLAPGGVFVIEAHYLVDLLEQKAFDTVYHEHVSYWALGPMVRLFKAHGLEITGAERVPIHHGQLRVTVARAGERPAEPAVREILDQEETAGLREFSTFRAFAREVEGMRDALTRTLQPLLESGKRIAGYGAPAKGNTFIDYLGLGPETIEYIADKSKLKQGLFTPGSHIPIVPPERLLEDPPDYLLILAWNFADEIIAQQREYARGGGRFILALPQPRIIGEAVHAAA